MCDLKMLYNAFDVKRVTTNSTINDEVFALLLYLAHICPVLTGDALK